MTGGGWFLLTGPTPELLHRAEGDRKSIPFLNGIKSWAVFRAKRVFEVLLSAAHTEGVFRGPATPFPACIVTDEQEPGLGEALSPTCFESSA